MRTKCRGFSVRIWSWILALTMILTLCQLAFAAEGGLTPTTTDGVAIEDQTDADVDITGNVAFTSDSTGGDSGIEPRGSRVKAIIHYNPGFDAENFDTEIYSDSYSSVNVSDTTVLMSTLEDKYQFIGWRSQKMDGYDELIGSGEVPFHIIATYSDFSEVVDMGSLGHAYDITLYAVYEKVNCVTNDRYYTYDFESGSWGGGSDDAGTAVYESDTIVDDAIWSDVGAYNSSNEGNFEIVRNLIPNETSPRYVYKLADLSTLTQAYLTCHPEYGTSADALQMPLSAIATLGALSGTFVVYPCFATKTVSELNVMSVPGTNENSFFVPYSTIARNGADMLVCMAKMQYVTDVSSDTPYQSPGITLSVSYPEIQTSSVNDFTSNTTKHNDIAYSWGPVSLASGTPNVIFEPGGYGTTSDELEYLVNKNDAAKGPSIQPVEGYVFIGWKSSLNEQVFSGEDPWTYADAGLDNGKTLTLSAVYEEAPADIPDVIFDLGGHGSSTDALMIQTLENGSDTVITFPVVTDGEPHRYAFSGWRVGIYDAAAGDYVDNGINVPGNIGDLPEDARKASSFDILFDLKTGKHDKAKFTAVYEKVNYVPEGGLTVPATDTHQLNELDVNAWTDVANMVPIRNLFADANGNYNYKLVNPSSITLGWYADDMTTTPTYYTKTKTEDAVAVKILSENASASGCRFWPVVTESPLATGIPVLPNGYGKFSVLVGSDIAGASMAELSFNGVPGRGPVLAWDLPVVSTDAEGKADPNALHSELEQQVVPGQFTGAVKLYYPEIYTYAMQPTLRYGFRILDHDYKVNDEGKIEITLGKGEYVDIEHVIYGDAATLMVAQVKIPYTRQPSFKKAQIYGSTAQDQIDLDTGMNSLNWMNNDVAVTPEGSATFKFRLQTLAAAQPGDYELIHMVPMAVGSDSSSYAIDTHETLIIHVTDKIPITIQPGEGYVWDGEEGGPWLNKPYEGRIEPYRPDVFNYIVRYTNPDTECIDVHVDIDADTGAFAIPGEDVTENLSIEVLSSPNGDIAVIEYAFGSKGGYRISSEIEESLISAKLGTKNDATIFMVQYAVKDGAPNRIMMDPESDTPLPAKVCLGEEKLQMEAGIEVIGSPMIYDAEYVSYFGFVTVAGIDGNALANAETSDLLDKIVEMIKRFGVVVHLDETDPNEPLTAGRGLGDVNKDGCMDLFDAAALLNLIHLAPCFVDGPIQIDNPDVDEEARRAWSMFRFVHDPMLVKMLRDADLADLGTICDFNGYADQTIDAWRTIFASKS